MNKLIFKSVLAFLLFSVTIAGTFAQKNGQILKIAVTTDVHGAYFPNDWYSGKPNYGSLAKVSAWVSEQRTLSGQSLILLDNGDLIQGDPASYFSNYIDRSNPNIAARLLNFMGYEAGTVGNHDVEAGHPVYDKLVKELNFPWLAANAVKTGTNEPYFKPYVTLQRSGLKITILGLITPKIPDWLPPVLWSGMEFQGMIESAKQWVPYIIGNEKPDLLVGLFHAGVDPNYGQQKASNPLNENASRLIAEQVDGFDIVFTGHDHRNWNLKVAGPKGDSVLILGSESRASEIAIATIRISGSKKKLKIENISGSHQEMKAYLPDPEFLRQFSGFIDTVQQYVNEPVGTISSTIHADQAYFGSTAFIDLIHHAQLELTGAEISFTAPLSFRATIPAGLLTIKDLFRLYKFENQLYTISLTGAEIKDYLNYSYSLWMKTMTSPDDLMLNMERLPDGYWRLKNAYYNFDSAAGIDYTVDLTKPAGQMVEISQLTNGQPFDLKQRYLVALNSYRGSGGGGHLSQGSGLSKQEVATRLIHASEMDFRFLLTEWIRKKGTIDPKAANNWKTIPADWTKLAAERDSRRLFNGN
jgi:2',3'-cyclic-nucleotide 2'-phosphodiesterase / 3'-nucleotidase